MRRNQAEWYMSAQLIPLNDTKRLKEAGLPFETEHQARWAERRSHANGTADAFIRIGRRVYLDPDRFHTLVREKRPVVADWSR